MNELNFSFRLKGWRNIRIKIIDEELFKEKFDNIFDNEPQEESYYNFLENCMDDCIEEDYESFDFDDWNEQWDLEVFEVLSDHLYYD